MSRLAELTQTQLEEVRRLENQWKNVILLAYEKPTEPAKLSPINCKRFELWKRNWM